MYQVQNSSFYQALQVNHICRSRCLCHIYKKTCYLQRRNSSGLMMNSLLKIFQVRVDRHATYLGLAGGGLGSIAKIGVTNGLLMGFTVGTVTTGILNSTLWKNKDATKSDS